MPLLDETGKSRKISRRYAPKREKRKKRRVQEYYRVEG